MRDQLGSSFLLPEDAASCVAADDRPVLLHLNRRPNELSEALLNLGDVSGPHGYACQFNHGSGWLHELHGFVCGCTDTYCSCVSRLQTLLHAVMNAVTLSNQ